MSVWVYVVVLILFLVLGTLEVVVPRRLDDLMGRLVGRAYRDAASEASRVRWIRLNGLLLLVLCCLMSFSLASS